MNRAAARKVRLPVEGAPSAPATLLVLHAAELLTVRGLPAPRTGRAASDLGIIEDGAVFVERGRIADVGTSETVLARHPRATQTLDASGMVVMPGLVDAHTHAVFAGSREREIEWKSQGLSYEDIATRGGGILETVRATRDASGDALARVTSERLRRMLAHGTTAAEVKSGYGLRTADEIKILRAAQAAAARSGVDIVRTFLGAHAVPSEFLHSREAYVDLVTNEMIDAVAADGLAAFCDVFVERGYFDADQGRRILLEAASRGLRSKVHADELSDSGGASLAAGVGATSADHLLHVSSEGIEALARAGTTAVLLPATSLASKMVYADGRRLIEAGVAVALGTDLSPNAWCESMQLVMALACHQNGLTPAEAIVAATTNAAHAIGLGQEVGSLEVGKQADLLIADVPSYRHLGYRLGGNAVSIVVKRGRVLETRGQVRRVDKAIL